MDAEKVGMLLLLPVLSVLEAQLHIHHTHIVGSLTKR